MFKFAQHGQCGTWVSELLPHTAKCVDDLALVKTVHTNAINHDPGLHVCYDRQRGAGQAEPRFVAGLRTGQREQRSAGVRGAHAELEIGRGGPGFVHPHVVQRLLGQQVHGGRAAACGRPGALCAEPAGSARCKSTSDARHAGQVESPGAGSLWRSGNADAHCAVRDGVSHADQRAGID